jgi:hypothetical protein
LYLDSPRPEQDGYGITEKKRCIRVKQVPLKQVLFIYEEVTRSYASRAKECLERSQLDFWAESLDNFSVFVSRGKFLAYTEQI